MSTLPISRLVRVNVSLGVLAAQAQNLSTLLILADSDVIDLEERIRFYNSSDSDQIALEFGSTSPEYLASVLWFEQDPQPTQLAIGRWAKTDTKAKLVGGTQIQDILDWQAITNGAFDITVDGTLEHVTALNFTTDTNMNAVAGRISAALATFNVTAVWNSVYNRFEFEGTAAGTGHTISFLDHPAGGTDISDDLLGTQLLGAYTVDGAAAETALQAAALMEANFGQKWYALVLASATPASDLDQISVAGFIESTGTKHLFGVTDTGADVLLSIDTTSLAYQLFRLKYDRTLTQYSSSNPFAVVSAIARALTVDYDESSSVITLMYKQEPGIVPETLNETQANAVESKNCNVFVAYDNNTAILEKGTMVSGQYIDTITDTDWFALAIQTGVFNVLLTTPRKVAQTDAGMHLLLTTVEAICIQAVDNGMLAPGTWNSAGFGEIVTGQFLDKGYYVFAKSVVFQDEADRANRMSVPIQIAAKLAGAIHDVDVSITVNQ